MNTYLESHDLTGKNVILLATSGGSGFGNTVKKLKNSRNSAALQEGKIINSLDIDAEIRKIFGE